MLPSYRASGAENWRSSAEPRDDPVGRQEKRGVPPVNHSTCEPIGKYSALEHCSPLEGEHCARCKEPIRGWPQVMMAFG